MVGYVSRHSFLNPEDLYRVGGDGWVLTDGLDHPVLDHEDLIRLGRSRLRIDELARGDDDHLSFHRREREGDKNGGQDSEIRA